MTTATKRIVYTRTDGGVCVVVPAPEYLARFETEQEALEALRTKVVPPGMTNVRVCDMAELPATRRFRGCWRQHGANPPTVDLPLARAQRLIELRQTRNQRLVASDGEMLRAQERRDAVEEGRWRQYRQALRDLPDAVSPALSLIDTPEALAEWEPDWPTPPVVIRVPIL